METITQSSTEKSINTNLSVLLIDDDRDDGDFFAETIKNIDSSFRFMHCKNSDHFFHYIDKSKADLIFLDMNMPTKSGLQCLLEIKAEKKYRHIPVIMYSVMNSEYITEETFQAGAHLFVVKPYSSVNFQNTLEMIFSKNWKIEQPRPRKENFVISLPF